MWIIIVIFIIFLFAFLISKTFNTYILIARNTTYIYEILSKDFKDRFHSKDVLLATCGVIDARKYIIEGSLSLDDIVIGVHNSSCGSCYLDLYKVDVADNRFYFLAQETDLLNFVYFVMQLEAIIFHIDTSVPPEHILSAVKSKKRVIEKEVKKTKDKYNSQGAPSWLKAETYTFMNTEAFAEMRDELGIIRPTSEQQTNLLFQELIKLKPWKDINPEILKRIFNNAKGDVEVIKRFIYISEIHNLVGNNFVKIANDVSKTDTSFVISMFALTLYRLGSDLVKELPLAKTEDKVSFLVKKAEIAFTSSLLCNPFFMESYLGIAVLFSEINKNIALEWCAKYKEAEGKLLNTPDEELNISQLNHKKELLDPEERRKTFREIAKHAPHLLPDDTEIDGIPSIREMIFELEAELMQRA